jgi:glycosyltransferase involved in cell wall biosynthesis
MNKLAICVLFYNRIENGMLKECLKSIIDADKPNVTYELVITDNGSEEDATGVLRWLDEMNVAYVYRKLPVNNGAIQGALSLMNDLIAMGFSHIANCDSDDMWKKDYLVKVWDRMLETGADFVGSYYEKFGNDSGVIEWKEGVTAMEMINKGAPPSSGLYKIEYFTLTGGWKPEMKFANDFEMHLRAGLIGLRYAMVKEALYRYRLHGNQETSGKWGSDLEWKIKAYKLNGIDIEKHINS